MSRHQCMSASRITRFLSIKWYLYPLATSVCVLIGTHKVLAQSAEAIDFNAVGTIWLLIASALVFFMNAGFAMLETGYCRRANAINVLAKNLIVFCISTLAFWLFGFRFMFGDSSNQVLGQVGFLLDLPFPSADNLNPFPEGFEDIKGIWEGRSFAAIFFFQLVFAGTAATIVSGAVAERIKFWAFILFSFILVCFIYPFTGYWVWGSGWLASPPVQFRDFAGSTVVHSVGGMAALVGAILLRPRKGKFGYNPEEGSFSGGGGRDTEDFSPHSLSFATLGCLILWLGWFGFNGGSTPNLEYVPHVMATTLFAAAVGGLSAIVLSPLTTSQKVSLSSIINGILGGLVGITASSAYVDIVGAGIIGAVSGFLVLVGDGFLKILKIDDPVGAVPVHLFCGGWGTVAVGIFASRSSLEYSLGEDGYNRVAQTLFQFLGWSIVVFVVSLLSLTTWILIGILLNYLNQKATNRQRQLKINSELGEHHGLSGQMIQLLQFSMDGLRVSITDEEQGSDETMIS